jgi:hypothetical protein
MAQRHGQADALARHAECSLMLQKGLDSSRMLSDALKKARLQASTGIFEAAGSMDDGHGTVTQSVHLRQAAGLVARGHQEDVSSRDELPVRQARRQSAMSCPRPSHARVA